MAKQPESVFWNRIKPKLKAIPKSWWFKVQLVGMFGIPDVIGVVNGRFVALELKVNKKGHGGDGELLQNHNLEKIRKAGGIAYRLYPGNFDEVYSVLSGL